MDISIIIGLVIALGVLVLILSNRDRKNDTIDSSIDVGTPPPNTYGGQVETKASVQPKSAPKPKAQTKKDTKIKLPSDNQLQKNTKGQLEELGRKHGVELDKRQTKANMISALKSKVK